jgi:prephenate dehydrogenase
VKVALVGYGRFGRALAGLLEAAQVGYSAFDPGAAVPDAVVAGDLASLVAGATHVVVAVPVPLMGPTLDALAPHLDPSQLVMDVGSVKLGPSRELARVLGDRIPWVATHPLFGPTSLARAERPLRVIVCPHATDAAITARAVRFWEALGCEVAEQSPEQHDRAMAMTHVLAFFVAKGLLDAGAGDDVVFAPPSFQAIARTLDAVRGDAGHLFAAIQRENPFAHDARRRLLDALVAVDRAIDVAPGAIEPIAIPDLGERSPELKMTREHIDEVDREIVSLLARRAELARRAGRAKAQLGAGVVDEARERALLSDRRAWATDAGLDPDAVEAVFNEMIRFSRRIQGDTR